MFHTAAPILRESEALSARTLSSVVPSNDTVTKALSVTSGSLDLLLLGNLLEVCQDLYRHDLADESLNLYASTVSYCKDCSWNNAQLVSHQLQMAVRRLQDATTVLTDEPELPDMYHEDECDVGPRCFKHPVFPSVSLLSSSSANSLILAYMELLLVYNRGVVQHAQSEYGETMRLYEYVALSLTSQWLPATTTDHPLRRSLLELNMYVQNNMGHITYMLGLEDAAADHFRTALAYKTSSLEYAMVVSNWCRVHWMSGDMSEEVFRGLQQVLCIRTDLLPWDHMDVASAHYNLGMAEYARNHSEAALEHLFSYLKVAASKAATDNNSSKQTAALKVNKKDQWLYTLDPIPALIYILLVKNEPKEDDISQELVRGLRSLQEKRACVGPQGPEVASVLNFIGTLLFHQRDNEHALLFFQEELRLEENLVFHQDDVSISVTCNNIGRILQELGRLPEAKHYYHRALKGHYGDRIEEWCALPNAQDVCPVQWKVEHLKDLPQSTMQLYSAVWYNLGLIWDKLGCYREATNAFQVSLGLRRALLGLNHADVACLLYNIGVLQMEQKLLKEATSSFREALRIRQNSPSTGHLNDAHVIQTLKKLAALHKAKGDINGALETLWEIVRLQEPTTNKDATTTLAANGSAAQSNHTKELCVTYREVAELYHANSNLSMAITMAQKSTSLLRKLQLAVAQNNTTTSTTVATQEFVVYTEELVAGLLLLGSLYHEDSEPFTARQLFQEASTMIARVSRCFPTSTALDAMQEVTQILAACHCAPLA
ncbi:Kinesin light chain [Seminavis robusta]|uniref:Kinesin light chain n=1 Tax=Seminavis robusta TaxID=568900 RepID=A0A9N8DRT4_9STRA|nr:Kinesin light chain [Seminavis robusta]|eukprot:Sro309_g113880.1 Kinesin light chain (773) ;mRNA; f:54221-56539